MPKESFLFVPYCAGQQDLATSKFNASDARSHAAAVSRQRRDNKTQRQHGTFSKPISLKLAPFQRSKTDTSSNDSDEDKPGKQLARSSVSPKTSNALGPMRGQRRQHMRAMQFSWRAGNVSADFRVSASFPLKSFGFSDLNHFGQRVVDYYKQVIGPVNHPVYTIFNVTNVYTSYWMQVLMQDEDYKPAGLAMVGAVIERVSQPGLPPSEDVRAHQATAVSRLQRRYNEALRTGRSAADDMVIITVLALASLARLLGDLRGYETHKNSMRAMVASRGGLGALGHNGLAQCALLQWDSFWVFETQGAPLFTEARPEHIPVFPAFPLSSDVRETFVKLPVGFQSLVMKGRISVELLEVLGRAADANTAGIDSLAPESMYHSKPRKYSDFVEACPCLGTSDTAKSTFEKKICLALLLYCSNAFTTARSSAALYASYRMELTRLLLRKAEPTDSPPEMECLFWICAVCIDSWRRNEPGSPLLPQGVDLLPVLRTMSDSINTESVMQKFFCYQDLLDGYPRYLELAGRCSQKSSPYLSS